MGKEMHGTRSSGSSLCPTCKQPVETVIKGRHKTLGIYVPVWGPGTCRSPECRGRAQDPGSTRTQEPS